MSKFGQISVIIFCGFVSREHYLYPNIPKREILIEYLKLYNFVKHTKTIKLDSEKLTAI